MAYSFPIFRKGMVFKTEQLVSVVEAGEIASRIKKEYKLYDLAFRKAVRHNNGASGFSTDSKQRIKQAIEESHILNFPMISFKLGEFSVRSRNSVTVCMHEHQSKIWTRLTCAAIKGKPATNLTASEVRHFFALAGKKATAILSALAETYGQHVRQAGVSVPKSQRYLFQLRAFNSTNKCSGLLLKELSRGMPLSKALNEREFRSELVDYFAIVLNKKLSPEQIKSAIKSGDLDVFGYKSPEHEAIFTAKIDNSQTDICGYGYDDKNKLSSAILSHATTKDLLKEYAQQF